MKCEFSSAVNRRETREYQSATATRACRPRLAVILPLDDPAAVEPESAGGDPHFLTRLGGAGEGLDEEGSGSGTYDQRDTGEYPSLMRQGIQLGLPIFWSAIGV